MLRRLSDPDHGGVSRGTGPRPGTAYDPAPSAEPRLSSFVAVAAIGSLLAGGSTSVLSYWLASHPLRVPGALLGAAVCTADSALVAGFALWALWPRSGGDAWRPSKLLLLNAAIGWVLLVPAVLLVLRHSVWAAGMAVAAAVVQAISMRKALPPADPGGDALNAPRAELFAASLLVNPWDWRALALAVCLYGGLLAMHGASILAATMLLAVSAFALIWQIATPAPATRRGTAARLAAAVLLAILFSFPELLPPPIGVVGVASAAGAGSARESRAAKARGTGERGFVGVVLWPPPQKQQIVAPVERALLTAGQPVVRPTFIPFDGPYFYFQHPNQSPGSRAHVAHGDPVALNMHSANDLPLVEEAHQSLATPIRLRSCRAISLTIENGDHRPGGIELGLLLTDSVAPGQPTVYLGTQAVPPLPPDATGHQEQTLTWEMPRSGKVSRFDAITVFFFPDWERATAGSKISLREFELVPR